MGKSDDQEHRSSDFFYHFTRAAFGLALRLLYRRISLNADRVPRDGPVLLVANHQSNLDPPLITGPIRWRRLEYMAKAELFDSSWFGRIIAGFGAVPVKSGSDSNTTVIRIMLRRLSEGHAVLVFPEGSRSEDGSMQMFKGGAALLVKRSRCPVVPIAVEGSFDSWPRDSARPLLWRRRLAVSFGNPISHDELMTAGAEAAVERLADEVDELRLELRRRLRDRTNGRFPPPGPGDDPRSEEPTQSSGPDQQDN